MYSQEKTTKRKKKKKGEERYTERERTGYIFITKLSQKYALDSKFQSFMFVFII